MNAIKFIQQHGVDKAMEVVECAPEGATHLSDGACHYVNADFKPLPAHIKEQLPKLVDLSDIKRLVESVYLVKEHNTLDRAIEYANSQYTAPEIKVCLLDAIADYRSIYSDNDMGDDSHIENHISPNCKKYDERVK